MIDLSIRDAVSFIAQGPKEAQQLRRSLVTQVEKTGSLPERAAAHEAWEQIGMLFAEEKLLGGGTEGLPKSLAEVPPATLDCLYGRDMADNLRVLASSIRALGEGAVQRLSGLDRVLRLAHPGSLLLWAATSRIRLKLFTGAATREFEEGDPATLRLIETYLAYRRAMQVVWQKREGRLNQVMPQPRSPLPASQGT